MFISFQITYAVDIIKFSTMVNINKKTKGSKEEEPD